MALYKVAVCLENMCEPYYFTEKFVEAVLAGCIPVYRASPESRESVLKKARWVDPADHGNNPDATIRHALDGDINSFQKQNAEWLRSDALQQTHAAAIYEKISCALTETIGVNP